MVASKKKSDTPAKKTTSEKLPSEANSPAKKSAAKKKTVSASSGPVQSASAPAKKKIYSLTELRDLPDHYSRDLIKLLVKNPTQAYVFWEITESSVLEKLGTSSSELSHCKWELGLSYTNDLGEEVFDAIPLQPYTKNYFLNFLNPVENLRASIELRHPNGKRTLLLESSALNLPPKKIANQWAKDWAPLSTMGKNQWKTAPSGEFYYLAEESDENRLPFWAKSHDGSSWGGGSSGNSSWSGGSSGSQQN